eukprot:m.332225 g.332225  ORF g.332225 m.332225 type:complete len:370 (-) comp55631_c0_seq16:222-1331(-)
MRPAVKVLAGLFLANAIVLHAVEASNHPRAGAQPGEQFMLFCLCMGRLGNQMDHLLGAIEFARALNRTIVVPPFLAYSPLRPLDRIPFSAAFNISSLSQYHRAISMEDFLLTVAPTVWPEESRHMYCTHMSDTSRCYRNGTVPHDSFWTQQEIRFQSHKAIDLVFTDPPQRWIQEFTEPVLVLSGAPAVFPVLASHRHVQGHLRWNDHVTSKAARFIEQRFSHGFIAAHIRRGSDWKQACALVPRKEAFMASSQCNAPNGAVTLEMCMPSMEAMVVQLESMITQTGLRSLYIGSDDVPSVISLRNALNAGKAAGEHVAVVQWNDADPFTDLRIFTLADHFIGNCVSSFTSVAVRYRRLEGKPVAFWGLP